MAFLAVVSLIFFFFFFLGFFSFFLSEQYFRKELRCKSKYIHSAFTCMQQMKKSYSSAGPGTCIMPLRKLNSASVQWKCSAPGTLNHLSSTTVTWDVCRDEKSQYSMNLEQTHLLQKCTMRSIFRPDFQKSILGLNYSFLQWGWLIGRSIVRGDTAAFPVLRVSKSKIHAEKIIPS